MSTALARKFRVDVTSDLTLAGGWVQLNGINDWSDNVTPNLEDASAYDTNGSASFEKTFEEWTGRAQILRRLSAGVYDAGQELVRLRARGQWGDNARVGVRWYDKDGGPEAYKGVALVGWERAQTGVRNLDGANITFTGTDVPLATIANPGVAAAAPVIMAASPSAVAAGGQVRIDGVGFIGTVATTGVKFGGVNATSWQVISDQVIVAIMPAGTAGSAPIIVTNAAGASTAFAYTRG